MRLDETQAVLEAKDGEAFEKHFAFAPVPMAEWVRRKGQDADEDTEQERAELGHGSFGKTFRVRALVAVADPLGDECFGEGALFAAKVIEVSSLRDISRGKEVVLREVRAQRKLQHRHVVRFLKLYQSKKTMTLVMELAGGGSLAEHFPPTTTAGPALPDVLRWMRQLAEAMAYIHSMGVYHRDIKPENVLLSERGQAPPERERARERERERERNRMRERESSTKNCHTWIDWVTVPREYKLLRLVPWSGYDSPVPLESNLLSFGRSHSRILCPHPAPHFPRYQAGERAALRARSSLPLQD